MSEDEKSGIRVKILFLIGTGTAKGQLNVFRAGTAYLGKAQRIADRYGVSRTTTSHWGQAQRIEDRHSISRRTENQEPHNPLPAGQNMAARQVSSFKMFCKKGRYLFIHILKNKRKICFDSWYFSCWHIMSYPAGGTPDFNWHGWWKDFFGFEIFDFGIFFGKYFFG